MPRQTLTNLIDKVQCLYYTNILNYGDKLNMTTEFAGQPGIKHVRQPEDSELCFAAIVSALDNQRSVEQVHEALVDSGISTADGSTANPGEAQTIQLAADTKLAVEPFVGISTERFITAINERLQDRKPVALLHKKNDDELDNRLHWSLIAGRYHTDGETELAVLMDPLQSENAYVDSSEVTDMVERTVEFFGGVWACALSIEQAV